LDVRDPAESADALLGRYHAFTERAYGIRPAPETVRVARLLAVLQEGHSPISLSQCLQATFAREQERYAAAPGDARMSGVNGIRQIPAESLKIDTPAVGPALVVLPGASAFVPEGMEYRVDAWGNLILETGE
jgi:hypothetical protein